MLTKTALTTRITSALRDNAKGRITPEQIDEAIMQACAQMSKDIPDKGCETLTLIAGCNAYPLPALCFVVLSSDYGKDAPQLSAWAPPLLKKPRKSDGYLIFESAPLAAHIEYYGSNYRFTYGRQWHVTDDDEFSDTAPNVPVTHERALFLLCLKFLMEQIGSTEIIEPMQLHSGLEPSQQPRTAADVHRLLNTEYAKEAGRLND